RIDVVGLSCYTWNWDFQLRVAAEAKLRNPNCLVIAGGPQPDHQDEDFFVKHRDIDVVVLRDGEITFSNILTTIAPEQRDLSTIKGLYLPGTNRTRIATGPPDIPGVFEFSPFLSQSAYFEKLISRSPDGFFSTTLETNRGCPYSCSFCDWGTSS